MPPGPLDGLKKATGINDNRSWWDHTMDYLIGEDARLKSEPVFGSKVLGNAMTGLDQLTYGHIPDDGVWKMGMAVDTKKGIEGIAKGVDSAVTGIKGMYSRLTGAADTLPKTMHPNKALSQLGQRTSPTEMKYRGLTDLLKGKGDAPVTRDEITSHLAANPLNVKVKNLGEPSWAAHSAPQGPYANHQLLGEFNTQQAALDAAGPTGTVGPYTAEPTQYRNYMLPGGDNYRETLIQEPRRVTKPATPGFDPFANDPASMERMQALHAKESNSAVGHRLNADELEELRLIMNKHDEFVPPNSAQYEKTKFKGPHWPDEDNILASVIHDERILPGTPPDNLHDIAQDAIARATRDGADLTDPYVHEGYMNEARAGGSRGRNIHELQGDWFQTGAKQGYAEPGVREAADQAQKAAQRQLDLKHADFRKSIDSYGFKDHTDADQTLYDIDEGMYGTLSESQLSERDELQQLVFARDDAYKAHEQASKRVADSAFKDDWPELALKQQVLDVANRDDLDWIGISDPETLIERYGTERFRWNRDPENPAGWQTTFEPQVGGGIQNYSPPEAASITSAEDLAAAYPHGANTAGGAPFDYAKAWKRMQAAPETGEYLPRAEGMRSKYGKEYPNTLAKILKPFGGTVEPGSFKYPTADKAVGDPLRYAERPAEMDAKIMYARLTPEMKAEIKKRGLSMLAVMGLLGGGQMLSDDPLNGLRDVQ